MLSRAKSHELNPAHYRGAKTKLVQLNCVNLAKVIGVHLTHEQRPRSKLHKLRFLKEMGDCSLEELMEVRKDLNRRWSSEELTQILHECIKGVKSLHAAGILHRNIQPANLALNREGYWMIKGFEAAESYLKEVDGKCWIQVKAAAHLS